MAYEFKKLNDVEIVETPIDTANVLIEEDGVIKKAPKSAVGGGGIEVTSAEVGQTIVVKAVDENGKPTEWECADMSSGGYDLVIDHSNYNEPILTHGSYTAACEKIQANMPPMVCAFGFRYTEDGRNEFGDYKNIVGIGINTENRIWINVGDMNYYALSTDNTVEYIQQ